MFVTFLSLIHVFDTEIVAFVDDDQGMEDGSDDEALESISDYNIEHGNEANEKYMWRGSRVIGEEDETGSEALSSDLLNSDSIPSFSFRSFENNDLRDIPTGVPSDEFHLLATNTRKKKSRKRTPDSQVEMGTTDNTEEWSIRSPNEVFLFLPA